MFIPNRINISEKHEDSLTTKVIQEKKKGKLDNGHIKKKHKDKICGHPSMQKGKGKLQ